MENKNALYNRIKKNQKQLKSFLKNNNISCYRIFDWDMPEYPLCIDIYEQNIHVAIYRTRHNLHPENNSIWLRSCLETIKEVFEIEDNQLFFKTRERKKLSEQYEKVNAKMQYFTVHENEIKFLVNLDDYLDTGLFLDHRNTRKRVMQESKGLHMLNLFAYTGAFSVYAAMGGAFTTTSIDLSNNYLQWAKNNFLQNNIPISKHQFIRADVKEWIKQTPSKLYDIIVLDPPTISVSEKTKSNFEVQSDHVEIINNTLNHLQQGGVLYFSNNFRDFVFEKEKIKASSIEDISKQSVPQDFRNKKIHACWRIVK